jgi:hypothetical protein
VGGPPDKSIAPFLTLVTLNAAGALGAASLLCGSGSVPLLVALHGACMILAWGAMLPLGGILARYFKVTPAQDFPAVTDNPFWWIMHRLLQYGGVAIAAVGLSLILAETHGRFDTLHGRLGLAVMVLVGVQIASPLMRGSKGGPTGTGARPDDPRTWRGDHYDMTPRRRVFEAWHKPVGWSLFVLAAVTILLGASLAGAPVWLFCFLGLVQGTLVLAVLDCGLRRRWVDTHAALWGPSAQTGRLPPA